MQNYTVFFRKPLIKIMTLCFALIALACSVILSQSNSPAKQEKKKAPAKIYNSSKSMTPHTSKEKSPESSTKTKQSENDKKKEEEKNKQSIPIMPSSKAPASGE